jgi:hypothetical protein
MTSSRVPGMRPALPDKGKLMSRLTDSLIRFATLRAAEGLSLAM